MTSAKIVVALGLFCCVLFLAAQPSETPPKFAGLMLWSTSIEAFALSGGEPPLLKSMFTPDRDILVTRVDAFDESGPRLNLNSITGKPAPCSPQPSLRIGTGSDGYTLLLANTFLPNSTSTYTDSGPLSLKFDPGSPISLIVIPPPGKQAAQCLTRQLNVQVHYTVQIQK
jgi:hypothetical protein